MKTTPALFAAGVVVGVLATATLFAQANADTAFTRFWSAATSSEAASHARDIVSSGIAFDEAYRRLREGRAYAAQPKGFRQLTHDAPGGPYGFAVNVPESYDPSRKSPAIVFLHGGVGREDPSPNTSVSQAASFSETAPDAIFVVPQAWRAAQWWSERQLVNVGGILDTVKRLYNIDENRVAMMGLSDGGTGAYYFAMQEPTPYASFVPMLGMALVLANEQMGIEGEMFPNNLRNRPYLVINGGRDIQYPIDRVDMYVERFKAGGVDIDYRPQPNAGHDRTWLPQMKDSIAGFLRDRPRNPLPDRLTWETSSPTRHNRSSWLVITALGRGKDDAVTLDDVNVVQPEPVVDFGIRAIGARIAFVIKGSNAEEIGLQPYDWLLELNGKAVKVTTDLDLLFAQIKPGTEVEFHVARKELPVDIKGIYNPKPIAPPAVELFARRGSSGRVDLVRTGNTVEATTKGVSGFTLLLSPDQFDFARPVKVVANGRVVFDGRVEPSIETLMKWAAVDNDRSALFGAELRIDLTR